MEYMYLHMVDLSVEGMVAMRTELLRQDRVCL